VVLAIDTKKEEDGEWYVYLNGGRLKTETKCFEWAEKGVSLGRRKNSLNIHESQWNQTSFAKDSPNKLATAYRCLLLHQVAGKLCQHFVDVP